MRLPQTYQLLLTVHGHLHLFLRNHSDVTKPIFVWIVKKLLLMMIQTLKPYFPITAFLLVIAQFAFAGPVCSGQQYITLKYYSLCVVLQSLCNITVFV